MPLASWFMNKIYTIANTAYDFGMTKQSDRVKFGYEKKLKHAQPFVTVAKNFVSHSISDKKIIITYVYNRLFFSYIPKLGE